MVQSPFVRNAWYIAALRSECGERMLARSVLGVSVTLFRTRSGRTVALRNRCSHRGYPLSEGSLGPDDVITCGYHGFRFDAAGTCLSVPGQSGIPGGSDLRSFPAAENGPFVWIWMGDPALADPAEIPAETGFGDPSFRFVSGHVVIDAGHTLIADNVLDLSHESFIHATKIGSREVAETGITSESDEKRWLVRASRVMRDVECPPTYRERTGLGSPIDREQHISFFVPSLYVLDVMVVAAESKHDPATGPRRPYLGKVVYGLTPLSEKRTHYFFAIGRDYAQDDPQMDAAVHEGQLCLIDEDAYAVAVLQRLAEEEGPMPEVSTRLDTAALIARRMLARRLRAETR
ncbi:aromatic ring-hydroxylating dioxygenase subunit alpha [Acrocarpospora sp. B8E8]|uniref:aromatic ring-hydroxylating dioxygenase subunit alpha n=1 Tax=Acrocarpospora sp. B8E8 TaxID=3153572 RepID=UPI00325ED7D8